MGDLFPLAVIVLLLVILTHVCIIAASSIAIDCRKKLDVDGESKVPFLIVVITLSDTPIDAEV